jgi:maltose O-acetyltransferase
MTIVTLVTELRRGLLVNTIATSHATPTALRCRLLRWSGIKLSRSAQIRPGFYFGAPNVAIGEGTFINVGCFFDESSQITIGRGCDIGMEVLLCTSSHDIGVAARRAGRQTSGPITIGDGCWLGARTTVLPGVTIAAGCVIAAGAIVTADTSPNTLYAGVPARAIRQLPTDTDERLRALGGAAGSV